MLIAESYVEKDNEDCSFVRIYDTDNEPFSCLLYYGEHIGDIDDEKTLLIESTDVIEHLNQTEFTGTWKDSFSYDTDILTDEHGKDFIMIWGPIGEGAGRAFHFYGWKDENKDQNLYKDAQYLVSFLNINTPKKLLHRHILD